MSPSRTPFTMTLLTLLTPLTLLAAAARAGDSAMFCGDPNPYIVTATGSEINGKWFTMTSSYGDDVTLFCSSKNSSSLTMRDEKRQLQADRLNSTTIQVLLQKLDEGRYIYYCTDSVNNCTYTQFVHVRPVMSVTATRVLRPVRDKYGRSSYLVPPGVEYNILCSGNSGNLTITDVNHKVQHANAINESTVMATVANSTEGEYYYWCQGAEHLDSILIVVEDYPEVSNFQCVVTPDNEVECSWNSVCKRNTFKLFVLRDAGRALICKSGGTAGGCKSIMNEESFVSYLEPSFTLQLETCNRAKFCSNMTFHVDSPASITILAPVYDLELVNTSSRGVTVAWNHYYFLYRCGEVVYKVEYRLLETAWRPVDASAVRCVELPSIDEHKYKLHVPLPCPAAHYEVRVFARHKNATEDRYWSEPATLYFTAASTGDADPACDADVTQSTEKPVPPGTGVLYEVELLISDECEETKALKAKIAALQHKLAKIDAILASMTESDAGTRAALYNV